MILMKITTETAAGSKHNLNWAKCWTFWC